MTKIRKHLRIAGKVTSVGNFPVSLFSSILMSSNTCARNNDGGMVPVKLEVASCSRCKDFRDVKISGSCPLNAVSNEINCCKLTRPASSAGSDPVSEVPKNHRISVLNMTTLVRDW
jgi:hypothetical protein